MVFSLAVKLLWIETRERLRLILNLGDAWNEALRLEVYLAAASVVLNIGHHHHVLLNREDRLVLIHALSIDHEHCALLAFRLVPPEALKVRSAFDRYHALGIEQALLDWAL